jgi:hypothetical protein
MSAQKMSRTLSNYNFLPSFDEFRERAKNTALSLNEKCGFVEAFRSGQSARIFSDICSKLTTLTKPDVKLLDIGAGCTELAHHIVETTGHHRQSLTVIDSPEMLSLLPDRQHVTKIEGPFPDCIQKIAHTIGTFDAILAYSVVQSVFRDSNIFEFVDSAAQLLNEHGQFLIGDIPNGTMRKRFMVSASGKAYHRINYSDLPEPKVQFNTLEPGQLDDGVILGLIARMRNAGFHAFVLPQGADLPMATRREDILIVRV